MDGRSFTSPADFNTQFGDWLTRTNLRVVRTIKAAPIDLIDADPAAMLALPQVPVRRGQAWAGATRFGWAATTTSGWTPTTTRRPDRNRPDGGSGRRPRPGPGPRRRTPGRRTSPGLGQRNHYRRRPQPRRDSRSTTQTVQQHRRALGAAEEPDSRPRRRGGAGGCGLSVQVADARVPRSAVSSSGDGNECLGNGSQ